MEEMRSEFEQLIFLRRGKGITLKELAEYIGCTKALLSIYENQKCNMSAEKVRKYTEYILNN